MERPLTPVVMKNLLHLAWLMENAAKNTQKNFVNRLCLLKMVILSMPSLIMDALLRRMDLHMITGMWFPIILISLPSKFYFKFQLNFC